MKSADSMHIRELFYELIDQQKSDMKMMHKRRDLRRVSKATKR